MNNNIKHTEQNEQITNIFQVECFSFVTNTLVVQSLHFFFTNK